MREIKFRAWHSKEKVWLDTMDTLINCDGFCYSMGMLCNDNITFNYGDEIILMQYTGLKDKNGKETYEGDIVKYNVAITSKWQTFVRKGIVEWHTESASFRFRDTEKNILREILICSSTEIIGNIYENSDLLK